MEADASFWLAIGSALYFVGAVTAVALCLMALRRGADVEVEIKAPSFSLKFQARLPSEHPGRRRQGDEPRGDVPTARTGHLDERYKVSSTGPLQRPR